jgi:hypothetical protein
MGDRVIQYAPHTQSPGSGKRFERTSEASEHNAVFWLEHPGGRGAEFNSATPRTAIAPEGFAGQSVSREEIQLRRRAKSSHLVLG